MPEELRMSRKNGGKNEQIHAILVVCAELLGSNVTMEFSRRVDDSMHWRRCADNGIRRV